MKKVMFAMMVSMFIATFAMAEVKPEGTIVPLFCGENVADLPDYHFRYITRVCLAPVRNLNFLVIRYSDGNTDYLFESKRVEGAVHQYAPIQESTLTVLRIGKDLYSPSYMTARTSIIHETKDWSLRQPCQITKLAGKTPTNEIFLVTDFYFMATTASVE